MGAGLGSAASAGWVCVAVRRDRRDGWGAAPCVKAFVAPRPAGVSGQGRGWAAVAVRRRGRAGAGSGEALRLLFLVSVVRRVGWPLGGDGAALRLRSLRRLPASPRHSSGAAPSDCGARPQEPLLGLGWSDWSGMSSSLQLQDWWLFVSGRGQRDDDGEGS